MNTSVQKYEFQLYLEGIRVPVRGANISISGQGTTANIAVPIDRNIRKILPNTTAHLFFRRFGEDWRLLFDGYVQGKTENILSQGSSISLQCRDISYNLDIMWKFYVNSQNPAETHPKIIRHYGTPTDPKSLSTRTSKETKRQQEITIARSVLILLENMINDILNWKEGKVVKANDYFQKLDKAAKFRNRFYFLEDSKMGFIFSQELQQSVFSREAIGSLQNTRSIIESYLSKVYYNTAYLPSPSYVKSNVRQILFKPDNFMIPAPMCNVVFPDMITGFDYSRNFMAEPTRLMVPSGPLINKSTSEIWQYVAYAPYEMKELAEENVLHYGLINDETYRGIMPVVEQTSQSVRLLGVDMSEKNKKESTAQFAAMKHSAEYLLQRRQTASRSFSSGECVFNPEMVINYPAVVIKDPLVIMGNVSTITHSIDAAGRINTVFSMSNCRAFDLELDIDTKKEINNKYSNVAFNWGSNSLTTNQRRKAELLGEDVYPYPFWLNDKYLPASIDETYLDTIGCKSIMSNLPNPNSTAKIENVRQLYSMYKVYEQKDAGNAFADKATARSIVTKKEYFATFLGLTKVNEDEYSNGSSTGNNAYFKDEHRAIIRKYKKSINEGVVRF